MIANWHVIHFGAALGVGRMHELLHTLHVVTYFAQQADGRRGKKGSKLLRVRRFRQFSDILGLTPRAERCYAPMLAECYIVFLRSILGHPKGIAAVLAAPHADTVEGHLVPLQDVVVALVGYDKRVVAEDPATWTSPLAALARPWLDEETMYDLFLKIKKVAERGKKSIKDAGDHPVPALDVEDALELLLDAVFRAAAQTQAFLRTELANWLSVDGRLTFDDFKRFFPDLPGAAAVSELAVATLFAAVQDRADTNESNRVKIDPERFAMHCWAHHVLPSPAYVERKPPKVEATAKKHHMFAQLDGLEFAELEHITKGTVD